MPEKADQIIVIPEGTEINNGPSEDSDSVILKKPFKALVTGEEADGAIPVKLFGEDGKPADQVSYFHQPPKNAGKD